MPRRLSPAHNTCVLSALRFGLRFLGPRASSCSVCRAAVSWREQTPSEQHGQNPSPEKPSYLSRKRHVRVEAGRGRSEERRAVSAPAFQNTERKLSQRALAGRTVPGLLLALLITPFSLPAYIGASLIGLEAVTTTLSLLLVALGSVMNAQGPWKLHLPSSLPSPCSRRF